MKLMIVDDEKLTREGLTQNIDWKSLGFDEVMQADDGLHALELSKTFCPDIVISDVRMPRMDGLHMAEKLQELFPFISIIFISGYSDKEYLKAAIKLKAISYVEKPISLLEIKEAVKEAVSTHQEKIATAMTRDLSQNLSRSALAATLIHPIKEGQSIDFAPYSFSFPIKSDISCFSFIIQCYDASTIGIDTIQHEFSDAISSLLEAMHVEGIHTTRQNDMLVYHIFSRHAFSDKQLEHFAQSLVSILLSTHLHFHIIVGKQVTGPEQVHLSYNSAVILLQNAFFCQENTFLIYQSTSKNDTFVSLESIDPTNKLQPALVRKDKEQVSSILSELLQSILNRENLLPNQVKDLYFKLFSTIQDACHELKISTADSQEPTESIWDNISRCVSIYALHSLLSNRIDQFFILAQNNSEAHSTIYMIKEYIASHYENEKLSIKDISEHVFLSSSYVCTLFKTETGTTLNQYITDYRIEKAKRLLSDPRNKIAEISSQVGYSDGNYFGKTFKKMVGLSPSEYREKENKQ